MKGKKTRTISLGFITVLMLGVFLIGQILLLTMEGKNVLETFFDPAFFVFNFTYFAFFFLVLIVMLAVSFKGYRR